jgi:hypothetical protein
MIPPSLLFDLSEWFPPRVGLKPVAKWDDCLAPVPEVVFDQRLSQWPAQFQSGHPESLCTGSMLPACRAPPAPAPPLRIPARHTVVASMQARQRFPGSRAPVSRPA